MDRLIYEIAHEVIVLNTDAPLEVRRVLEKYEAFRSADLPPHKNPVLEVWGGQEVMLQPEDQLLEQVEDYAFSSRVYERASTGQRIVQITQGSLAARGLVSPDWSELRIDVPLTDRAHHYLIDRLIMIAYSVVTAPLGLLKVHASVIELGGKALVLMGVSGTGKSTHSRLWIEQVAGCTLLNDDEPIIRLMPTGQPRVYGCPWSGSTPCYRNEWAEVKAFVHLYQAPFNRLTKLGARDAFASLYTSCAFMHSTGQNQAHVFNSVADVLSKVGVYRLDNKPDREAVMLTYNLLLSLSEYDQIV